MDSHLGNIMPGAAAAAYGRAALLNILRPEKYRGLVAQRPCLAAVDNGLFLLLSERRGQRSSSVVEAWPYGLRGTRFLEKPGQRIPSFIKFVDAVGKGRLLSGWGIPQPGRHPALEGVFTISSPMFIFIERS
jgi:hypothetical protein